MKGFIPLILILIVIMGIFLYSYYKPIWEHEQKSERERIAQQESYEAAVVKQKNDRMQRYLMAWDIGMEYFEEGLTTEETEKRVRQLIAELPEKNYYIYARVNDIKNVGKHREIDFISPEIGINLRYHYIRYPKRLCHVFYDDNSIITDAKKQDRFDLLVKVKDVKITDYNEITIYSDIIYLEEKYANGDYSPTYDNRLGHR